MRCVIKNPVLNNPWIPNRMPNNFRGCHVAAVRKLPQLAPVMKKIIRRSRPRKRIPKLQKTQNFADQLAPLYPSLTKSQVTAALTLTNNNLHQSRLLLDQTNQSLKKKTLANPILDIESMWSYSSSSTGNSITDDSFSTATLASGESRSSTSSVFWFMENMSGSSARSNQLISCPATDNSKSCEYDFVESDSYYEPIQSWSSHKREIENKKKIGVSIVRCPKGLKAFLL